MVVLILGFVFVVMLWFLTCTRTTKHDLMPLLPIQPKYFISCFNYPIYYSRVGLLTYSDNARLYFNLNDYGNKYDILNALPPYYTGGTTNTAGAIRLVLPRNLAIFNHIITFLRGGAKQQNIPCVTKVTQNRVSMAPKLEWPFGSVEKESVQGRIQDFVGGPAEFWPQRGALSPNFAQMGFFSLNWKLHDFEKILGANGAQAPGPPGSASAVWTTLNAKPFSFLKRNLL